MRARLIAFLSMLAMTGAAFGAALHVSPTGDDKATGAADAPIRSLGRLQSMLAARADVTEVVFHDGVYAGTLNVAAPQDADLKSLPPLLLRAAEGAKPVLDGGLPLPADKAAAVEGAPGVFRLDAAPFRTEAQARAGRLPALWDRTARTRYDLVADLLAVKSVPGSYTIEGGVLYIHTAGGRGLGECGIEVGRLDAVNGLVVSRPNVTVRGLAARGYTTTMFAAGFVAGGAGEKTLFEDCHASNCSRGFLLRADNARLLRCRAEDVGCGALLNGLHGVVEECDFYRGPRDRFRVPMQDVQEDTGIEVYYPAGGNTVIRRNRVRGFSSRAVLFKCKPGEFLVERNTFVDNTTGLDYLQAPHCSVTMRDNVVLGSARAMNGKVNQSRIKHRATGNVVFAAPWTDEKALRENVAYMNTVGENNLFADPRLAAPEAGHFRLLPDSPCLSADKTSARAGAAGPVPADHRDVHPPQIDLSVQPALSAIPLPQGAGDDAPPLFAASRQEFPLRVRARDADSAVALLSVRVGEGPWSEPAAFAEDAPVKLPAGEGEFEVQARAADNAGNWSRPAAIRVRAAVAAPRLAGAPVVRASRFGVAISFQTNVECHATGEIAPGKSPAKPLLAAGATRPGDKGAARRDHTLGLLREAGAPEGPWAFRVRLATRDGAAGQEFAGEFRFDGEPAQRFVAPDGQDAEDGGTREKPWRTLQYAVDRALPGDRVVLRPGLYIQTARITRGGVESAPLVIAAEKKWEAVLDGARRVDGLITIERASDVVIEGMEMRWFGDIDGDRAQWSPAIQLTRAPRVTVRECRIWNDFWGGRLSGRAIVASESPGFALERSLLFRLDWAISLHACPGSRLVSNTLRAFSHGGIGLSQSIAGTVVRNNSFNYCGNYTYWITVKDPAEMETFDSDYNNLGTRIRLWRDEPGVAPNLPESWGSSKTVTAYQRLGGTFVRPDGSTDEGLTTAKPDWAFKKRQDAHARPEDGWLGPLGQRYKWLPDADTPEDKRGCGYLLQNTFEDWQAFSGKDKHSIYADPKHRDIVGFDFRLLPDSPNIGAGEGGANLGALPVCAPEKPSQPAGAGR